jgi:hypothetical protein
MSLPYHTILAEPLAFWAANCNKDCLPDSVRCNGVAPSHNLEQLSFYVSHQFSETFRANLTLNPSISMMACSVHTFESYQYKGSFISIRECTEEEVDLQRSYLEEFAKAIVHTGLDGTKFFDAYFFQPSYTITMTVEEIFEQTPRKGTGNAVQKEGGTI